MMETSMNRKEKLPRLPTVKLPKKEKKRSRGGCKNCKEKKKGCSKEKPTCQRCRERGLECEYPPIVPQRRLNRRRAPSTTRGGSPLDSAGPSTQAMHEVTGELEDLSLPEDTSYDSSSASVTPSLAPSTIRSPLDLPYFRNTLAPLLVVSETENPLVDLVLPLSERSETLLNAICLVAKAHQAQGDPAATPSGYLDLYQLVLRGLRNSVSATHASDPDLHLATNVLLSYYEMIQGQSNASKAVRVYLGGAFSVLQLESGTRTATTHFLEKVLYFLDVLMSLSMGQAPLNADPRLPNVLHPPSSTSPPATTDPIFGLSAQLWPTLHRLACATHLKHQIGHASGGPSERGHPSQSFVEMTDDLEKQKVEIADLLRRWPQPTSQEMTSAPEGGHLQMLIDHAETYRAAGLIHLYRELYELEPKAAEVQALARSILEACQRILTGNGPTFGLLWPLFTAATNLVDDADIASIRGLFSDFAIHRRTNNISLAWKICEQVWMRRGRGMREGHWHQASADLLEAVVFG